MATEALNDLVCLNVATRALLCGVFDPKRAIIIEKV